MTSARTTLLDRALKRRNSMTIEGQGFLARALLIWLAAVFAMPIVASAQGGGRGKPVEVFVNGHAARDGRPDQAGQRRRGREDDWRRRKRNRDDWRNRQAGDG